MVAAVTAVPNGARFGLKCRHLWSDTVHVGARAEIRRRETVKESHRFTRMRMGVHHPEGVRGKLRPGRKGAEGLGMLHRDVRDGT